MAKEVEGDCYDSNGCPDDCENCPIYKRDSEVKLSPSETFHLALIRTKCQMAKTEDEMRKKGRG